MKDDDHSIPDGRRPVADWIGEEVVSGRWQPGRSITENAVASPNEVVTTLGVSRQPVREALRLLVDRGWSGSCPGSGPW